MRKLTPNAVPPVKRKRCLTKIMPKVNELSKLFGIAIETVRETKYLKRERATCFSLTSQDAKTIIPFWSRSKKMSHFARVRLHQPFFLSRVIYSFLKQKVTSESPKSQGIG